MDLIVFIVVLAFIATVISLSLIINKFQANLWKIEVQRERDREAMLKVWRKAYKDNHYCENECKQDYDANCTRRQSQIESKLATHKLD